MPTSVNPNATSTDSPGPEPSPVPSDGGPANATTTVDRPMVGFPEVETTELMETDQQLITQVILEDIVEIGGVALITGAPGLGKTAGVVRAVETLGVHAIYYPTDHTPNPKDYLAGMLRLLGVPFSPERATKASLMNLAIEELRRQPVLICNDEAQNNSVGGFRAQRHLIDTPGVQAAWANIGDERTRKILNQKEKPLLSRVDRNQYYHPFSDDEAVRTMPQLHPLYANTPHKMLRRMNQALNGNFRAWSKALETGLRHRSKVGSPDHVTDALWELILTLLKGGTRR